MSKSFPWIICFEGLPAAGKSTLIKTLLGILENMGLRVLEIDLEIVKEYRSFRQTMKELGIGMHHLIRSIIFWVLRLIQDRKITSIIDGGKYDIILLNRFWGSTLANDLANGIPRWILSWVGKLFRIKPDITIFLDVPISVILERKNAQSFEDMPFVKRIETEFKKLAKKEGWIEINGNQPPSMVVKTTMKAIGGQFGVLRKKNLFKRPFLKLVGPQDISFLDLEEKRAS
ncbi:thymidylate kinase [Candidatus Azambacteria bacterium]|nr:thymidylate kinase [Candidatus Azambacteria bacterium]